MTIKEYKDIFTEKLAPLYDVAEAERFFYISLEELKGWKRMDYLMRNNETISGNEEEQWQNALHQLEQYRPIQYIFGKAYFYSLEFKVTENTLIPRPETEELVEWIIHENNKRTELNILDIGTGTGCIPISLAKNLPQAQVAAIDVSAEALAVAKENALTNDISVNFIQTNILAAESLPQQYDVIVSNPPYVRNLEKAEIKPNVLEHEPHLALFVEDNNPLIFYRKIAQLALHHLKPGGKLYYEINQYLGPETVALLEDKGFKNVVLRKDLFGNDRMISCTL
ncbi:peptide chain release factor N(5)-glutamine methyltransferase [Flavobacterium sp. RHBU_3]|uniref:peptide chain release factor N(5)-glutamine methyltransferase n=1 Tax=Flavobacterium sp. RHBU_3 TaxID=3391184 RepID=UPI00398490C0